MSFVPKVIWQEVCGKQLHLLLPGYQKLGRNKTLSFLTEDPNFQTRNDFPFILLQLLSVANLNI